MKRAFLAVTFVATNAAAQGDSKRADALFNEGLQLLDEGRIAEACDRLSESKKIESGIGVTLYLADCEERRGHWIAARELYREGKALAEHKLDGRASDARKRADALTARMPSIQVKATGAPSIEIDGATSDAQAHEIDPGRHVVRARTKDRTWENTVDVPAQKTLVTVEVPSLDVEQPKAKQGIFFTPWRIAGVSSAGVGFVLFTIGLGLGADAISKKNASNDMGHCDPTNHCDDIGIQLRKSADGSASASTALFLIGVGGMAAGAALFFLSPQLSKTVGANGFQVVF